MKNWHPKAFLSNHPRLLRAINWETALLLSFICTTASGEFTSNISFKPLFSEVTIYLSFALWLVFSKAFKAVLFFYVHHLNRNKLFLLLGWLSLAEIPEALIFYEKPWFHLLQIPICCDTFELCILSYIVIKRLKDGRFNSNT